MKPMAAAGLHLHEGTRKHLGRQCNAQNRNDDKNYAHQTCA